MIVAFAPDSFPKAGIYFLDSGVFANLLGEFEVVSFTVPGATFEKVEFKPLGAEYISDEIARTAYVDEMATRAKQEAENNVAVALTDYAKKEAVETLEKRLNAVADSDDETLDQLSEIVDFIKNNMDPIEAVTAQSDWEQNDDTKIDYIKNRPFYDAGGLEPITWDGVVGDRVTVTFDGLMHVKVSDTVFSANDLVGATISVGSGETGPVDESQVYSIPNVITMYGEFVTSVADIAQVLEKTGLSYPETGTYFASGDAYIASLIFAGGGIKTLDEKFIPDTIARKADVVVEWGKF
jgi:hypothetical protein